MVKFFCTIVDADSAFEVNIGASDSVYALKKAIKETKPNDLENVEADRLRLFLATENDARFKSKDLLSLQMRKKEVPEKSDHFYTKEELNNPSEKISAILPSKISDESLYVLVETPKALESTKKRKRWGVDYFPDAWMLAVKDEEVAALPSTCKELKEHLQRELRVKIPIDDSLYTLVQVYNTTGKNTSVLNKLFDDEPPLGGRLSHRTATIVGSFIDPIVVGYENAIEGTYQYLWDSLITGLLMRVINGKFRRNKKVESILAELYRPNFCFYPELCDMCVFRGEEQPGGTLRVPVKELHDNLTWKYGAAPYILGYATAGRQVSLVAIRKDEKLEFAAKAEVIETYNMGDLHDRLTFLLALLNLSTLFRPIADLIPPLGIVEYGIIQRENGVQLAFAEDCVEKIYPPNMPSHSIILNLSELHCKMEKHSVPNVVQLYDTSLDRNTVVLAPIGRFSSFKNVHQFLMALRDILEALAALHAINLMHRDLRWDNVLKYPDEEKWFLIDFDEGAESPAKKVTHLQAESHAPEISSSSTHTVKVDIWSVGFLLETAPIYALPPELECIQEQCLQDDPSKRPTATSILKSIESLLQ